MDFKDGSVDGVRVMPLEKHADERGWLMETYRGDTLPQGVEPQMSYVSFTEPGVGRGPHEHRQQTDVFTFIGPGTFELSLWDNRRDSPTYRRRCMIRGGSNHPITVVVPPGVVHGYRNISPAERGMVINYPDRLYGGMSRKEPVDEIRHEDAQDMYYREFTKP